MQGMIRSRSLAVALASIGVAAFAAPALAGEEHGKSADAPGQNKPAGEPAQPTAPQGDATGHTTQGAPKNDTAPNGKAKGHAKPKKTAAPAPRKAKAAPAPKAKGKPAPAPAKPKTTGPAGKTTICHATGSATNPYVTITVSDNALKAHRAHQDGRDIVPAPAGGCPKTAPQDAASPAGAPGKDKAKAGKVTLCHATGSATNPYVKITISEHAVDAHKAHQDGRDIIPAPAGDCPAQAAAPAAGAAGAAAPAAAAPAGVMTKRSFAVTPAQAAAPSPLGAVLGATFSAPATRDADTAGVTVTAPRGAVLATRESAADDGTLPFTGADLGLLLAAGSAALLAGFALRRAAAGRSAA